MTLITVLDPQSFSLLYSNVALGFGTCNNSLGLVPRAHPSLDISAKCRSWIYFVLNSRRRNLLFCGSDLQYQSLLHHADQATGPSGVSPPIFPCLDSRRIPRYMLFGFGRFSWDLCWWTLHLPGFNPFMGMSFHSITMVSPLKPYHEAQAHPGVQDGVSGLSFSPPMEGDYIFRNDSDSLLVGSGYSCFATRSLGD